MPILFPFFLFLSLFPSDTRSPLFVGSTDHFLFGIILGLLASMSTTIPVIYF
jgi:hypothetical protein